MIRMRYWWDVGQSSAGRRVGMDGWIENPIRSWVGGWCTAVRGRGSRTPIGRLGRGFRTGDITRGPIQGRYRPRGPRAAVTMRSRRARGRIGRARPVGMLTGSPTRRLNFPRAGSHRGLTLAVCFAATTRWPTKAEVESMAAISFVGRCRLRVGATGASAFMGRRGVGRDPTLPYSLVSSVFSRTNQLLRDVTKRSTLKNLCFAKWEGRITTHVEYV